MHETTEQRKRSMGQSRGLGMHVISKYYHTSRGPAEVVDGVNEPDESSGGLVGGGDAPHVDTLLLVLL